MSNYSSSFFKYCIEQVNALEKYISFHYGDYIEFKFNIEDKNLDPILKELAEWDDRRGWKVLDEFQFKADEYKKTISEAIRNIKDSVQKSVSDLGEVNVAYEKCAECMCSSMSEKLYYEWNNWKEVHW